MKIQAKGHWQGDPTQHCEELTLTAEGSREREQLAALLRVLAAPATRERLFEEAEAVEAAKAAAEDPVLS